ncbi:MAG: L,D-transpeptidase, partial [Hyphomicrobium sp.]
MARSQRPAMIGAAFALVCLAAQSQPASAQLFWDWGGKEDRDGSGRQIVPFNARYTGGQIIVSFGDRRLYLIARPGEAISYPIAIPREEDRWQGITKVTDKRVNPSWRPTPDMLRENPRLPTWVPGGHRMNPLGVRALYLGSSTYR